MPIIVSDVTFEDSLGSIYITLPQLNVSLQTIDIYCNSVYLKINYPPYFYELDFPYNVDARASVTKIGDGKIVCEIVKVVKELWSADDGYKFIGPKTIIFARRNEAQTQYINEEKDLREKNVSAKREKERELVRVQIQVERDKRERIEAIKEKEKLVAAEGIKKWAVETIAKKQAVKNEIVGKRPISRIDSAISEIFQTNEEEFIDDDDIDVEAIRLRVDKLFETSVPMPRERKDIPVTFSSRDKIPTKTARESQDAKWRLRIKLAEQIQHKPLADTLQNLSKASSRFTSGDYESALHIYNEIYIQCNDFTALCNRSACWLKLENFLECIADCTKCLERLEIEQEILLEFGKDDGGLGEKRSGTKSKMYARRGAAYVGLCEKEKGVSDFEIALKCDKDNEGLRLDLLTLKE